MNTIKIRLSTSGRIAGLDKNFPLYCGQFQNVLLNIWVPTEILASGFEVGQCVNTLDPTDNGDEAELNAYLSEFIKEFTGDNTRPHEGDVVFYLYDHSGTYTYYTAQYTSGAWAFTEVDYFNFGEAGANVKIGMVGTKRNGVVFKTQAYYTRYVKKFMFEGVEYALYERQLPRAFATEIGDQTLVINVTNVKDNSIENIVTSQTAVLPILPSTVLDGDEPIEASELEQVEADLAALSNEMSLKQDKHDAGILFTAEKTVVGALNDLNTRANAQNAAIADNKTEIDKIKDGTTKVPSAAYADEAGFATNDSAGDNIATEFSGVKSRIADLESIVGTGEDFIGTTTINYDPLLPVNAAQLASDLGTFVANNTSPSRAPKGGDSVIVIQTVVGGTDKNYKFIYTGTTWEGYEIPPIELAGNGSAGLVKGTYGIGATYNTLVDIVDGEILNIWVKVDGSYKNLVYILSVFDTKIADIISGAQVVGEADTATKDSAGNNIATLFANIINGNQQVGSAAYAAEALKATQDALGNNIVNTYLTQVAGATKAYVKDYALPKEFNNVLYLSAAGFTEEIPTTPASGIQLTASPTAIGETLIGTCEYTLGDVKFQLSRKNSYSARYYIKYSHTGLAASLTCIYKLKILTYAQKAGQSAVLLSSELTDEMLYIDNRGLFKAYDFGINFDALGDTVLDLTTGDKVYQEIYWYMDDPNESKVDVYCNATYPSRLNLNTATTTIVYRESEVGEAIVVNLGSTLIDGGNIYFQADGGGIANEDYYRLIEKGKNGALTIIMPDMSSQIGVTADSHIYIQGIGGVAPNVALCSNYRVGAAKLEDFEALKCGSNYILFGTFLFAYNQILVDTPKIAHIRRL